MRLDSSIAIEGGRGQDDLPAPRRERYGRQQKAEGHSSPRESFHVSLTATLTGRCSTVSCLGEHIERLIGMTDDQRLSLRLDTSVARVLEREGRREYDLSVLHNTAIVAKGCSSRALASIPAPP